jgi:hypothetical protein
MGQYFTPVFLNSTGSIVHALNPADYGSGDKLAGNTRADMPLMHATQVLLSLDGALRLVWAGDNADDEPNGDPSLYFGVQPHHFVRIAELLHRDCRAAPNMSLPDPERRNVFGVVCNEDMHEFIDHVSLPIDDTGWRRTPLPRLTAEAGPGAEGRALGTWARDRLCYRQQRPDGDWADVTAI